MSTAAVKELVGMPTLPITKNLMSKISETPTPGGYIGPKETLGSEQELLAQKGQATEDLAKADIGVEKAKREEEASKLDIDAQSKRELVESIRGLPEKTALDEKNEQFKNLAFVPTKDTVQDIAGLFSLINVIGMAIGGGGKQNAQMAMHAMNGMAEGYQKGRSDLYRKEQIQFDKNFKAMQAAVQTLEKDYTRAVELEKTNKEAGRIERQVALARQNSPVLKALEDRAGVARTLDVIKDLAKSKDTAVDKFNSLKKIEEDKLAKQRAEDIAERRHKETLDSQLALRKATLEGKQLDKVLPLTQGVRSIENLMTQLRDPEVQAGLQAKVAPLFQKITSLGNSEFETAVNKELSGNDKTTLFLKDALLETYAIERAAKGGQRLTVQDMKMVGPVLDPTNYKPETYNQLLESRRRSLYNSLGDLGYSPTKVKEMSVQRPYEPFGGEAPKVQKPAGAPDTAKQAPDGHWYSPDPDKPGKYLKWD